MRPNVQWRWLALGALALSRAAAAVDNDGTGRAWTAMSSKIRSSDTGDTVVFFATAVAVVLAAIVLSRLYNRAQGRRASGARAGGSRANGGTQSFRQRAVALGFRAGELKTLRQIAGRLAPKSPVGLLINPAGRQRLVGDLDKRIRHRQRELNLLTGMLSRLEVAGDDQYHARETVRVVADIPVWFVQKVQVENPAEEGEEGIVNMEPVEGRLLDLSEGGAAVTVDLPLNAGEMVEFWSADTEIWIPPLPAGVVHTSEGEDGGPPMVHLHFLDPPLADIRRAMQDVQLLSRDASGATEGGEPPPGDAPPTGEGELPTDEPPILGEDEPA